MNTEEIIRMARKAGASLAETRMNPGRPAHSFSMTHLERFVAIVAAAEREKSLRLWMLLDDVDTADDIAKTDDAIYRSLCRQAHAKRWDVLTGDEIDAAIRARGQA